MKFFVSLQSNRGISSAGRAQGSQSWGQEFDPPMLHKNLPLSHLRGIFILSPLSKRPAAAMCGSDLTLAGGIFWQHDQHQNLKSYKTRSGRKGIERRQLKNMLKNSRSYPILFQHIHSPTAFKSHLGWTSFVKRTRWMVLAFGINYYVWVRLCYF